jgi:hypothetical protein
VAIAEVCQDGRLAAEKMHNAPCGIKFSLFDAAVPEVEFVLAGDVLALAKLCKMQSTGSCGLAMSGTLTARSEHVSAT